MKKISLLITLFIIISNYAQNKPEDLVGVWQQEGYGRIIKITKSKTYLFDICKTDCTKNAVMPTKKIAKEFSIKKINDTTLIADGFTKYYLYKLDKLPTLCTNKTKNKKDPFYNFDVLWQTFKEHYVYFKERNINWDAMKLKYRSQINKNTTDFDLFILLDKMLIEFKDGHTNMYIPRSLSKKYHKRAKKLRALRKVKLLDSLGQDYKFPGIHVDKLRHKIVKNYVEKVNSYNYGILNYGLINNNVALVQINGMTDFANYNIPQNINEKKAEKMYNKKADKSENYTKDCADGAGYIADKLIEKIKNTKTCIIDLRFNGGGFDEVQLEILKRFATKETLLINKYAKNKNGYTPKQSVFIKPTKNAYKGNVFILTSHQTASAAEDFILGSISAIPNAIRIGSNTEGIFSDILDKKLPNGWEYGLSNEIYESEQGKSYEVIGIEPHHKIEYPKKGYWFYKEFYDNKTGKDLAIEKAISLSNN